MQISSSGFEMRSLKSRTGVSCGSTAVAAARCGLLLHLLCGWYSDAAWEGGGGGGGRGQGKKWCTKGTEVTKRGDAWGGGGGRWDTQTGKQIVYTRNRSN